MKEYIFTFEFKGGTYFSKILGQNLDNALIFWGNGLNVDDIYRFGEKTKTSLINAINENDYILTGIEGISEITSISILSEMESGFLHAILLNNQEC